MGEGFDERPDADCRRTEYVYPGSFEDLSTEAIAVAAKVWGARGSGTMQLFAQCSDGAGLGVDNAAEHFCDRGWRRFSRADRRTTVGKQECAGDSSAVWGVPIGLISFT